MFKKLLLGSIFASVISVDVHSASVFAKIEVTDIRIVSVSDGLDFSLELQNRSTLVSSSIDRLSDDIESRESHVIGEDNSVAISKVNTSPNNSVEAFASVLGRGYSEADLLYTYFFTGDGIVNLEYDLAFSGSIRDAVSPLSPDQRGERLNLIAYLDGHSISSYGQTFNRSNTDEFGSFDYFDQITLTQELQLFDSDSFVDEDGYVFPSIGEMELHMEVSATTGLFGEEYAAVPLPAAAWFFLSSLAGLSFIARRK